MGTLYLIGVGMTAEDITVKGLEAAKKCDKLFLESYTSIMEDSRELEEMIGKEIIEVGRRVVEQEPERILKKDCTTGLLVCGDPMTATTHSDLVLRAEKEGLMVEVIHAPSIFTSVCESGLHIYSFGPPVSVPKPSKNYSPTSYYEKIKKNKELGLHTLLLLDVGMTAEQGLELLRKAEASKGKIFGDDSRILILARMGFKDQRMVYSKIKKVKEKGLPKPPHALVVPGNLHFKEEEALERFSG